MTAAVEQNNVGTGRVTQLSVLQSEWIKLRSLRSTWWSLRATVVIIAGLGTLFSAIRAHHPKHGPGGHIFIDDPTQISLRGVFLAQLAIGVLGVLVITGEYATGMIHSSVSAVPRRGPILVAKALVFAALAYVVTQASTVTAFFLGQWALSVTHHQATLGSPHALRAATLVAIVLVLPLLTQTLPSPYDSDLGKYLPLNAGTQIIATTPTDPAQFGPWSGLGVVAAWAATAIIARYVILRRRDA